MFDTKLNPPAAESAPEQPLTAEILPDDDPVRLLARHASSLPLLIFLAQSNIPQDVTDDDLSTNATESLSSSVLAYRTIQGRTYHSERGNAHYW